MADTDNISFQETLDTISRFLEAAIHTVLCVRQVYPADIFERKKLFDVPVWRSRHPKLSSYIAQVVDAIVERLQEGTVEKAILAVKDATSNEALEYFVFQFTWLAGITASMFKTPQERDKRPITGTPRSHVELVLRALLLKIASVDSQLIDLPAELTFTVFLEMTAGHAPPTDIDTESGEAPRWAPDQTQPDPSGGKTFPLKRAILGPLAVREALLRNHPPALKEGQMQVSAEETEAKTSLEQRSRDRKGKGRAIEP